MNKKTIQKLNIGALVTVRWEDAPDNKAILLEKPWPCKGDISISCLHLGENPWVQSIIHKQIIAFFGKIR